MVMQIAMHYNFQSNGKFLSFFRYCTTPSRGLRAGGLRLKATVQKVYGKRKDKDDRVKKNVQEELKEG